MYHSKNAYAAAGGALVGTLLALPFVLVAALAKALYRAARAHKGAR